jgi:hypothetical protein
VTVRGSEKHATHLREARGCTDIFAEDAWVQVKRAALGEEIERCRPGDRELRPSVSGFERDVECVSDVLDRLRSSGGFFLDDEEPAPESRAEKERSACRPDLANIEKAFDLKGAQHRVERRSRSRFRELNDTRVRNFAQFEYELAAERNVAKAAPNAEPGSTTSSTKPLPLGVKENWAADFHLYTLFHEG